MAFKLVKILGSQTNAPEMTLNIPCGTDEAKTWGEGTALCVDGGVLKPTAQAMSADFMVMKTTTTRSAQDTIPCFKVTQNMVFEASVGALSADFKIGYRPMLMSGNSLYNASAGATYYHTPIVVDMLNAKVGANQKVLVMFDRP